MNRDNIKKVHVIYKTHLDIGFTDMGQTVLDKYVNEHIPHAIRLALELNREDNKKFIWTVGSFLIDYYMKHAKQEEAELLEEAIEKGYICWHGIAVTTHTELMDRDLFEYSLSLNKRLNERFHKQTIASKMTDVPGHTRAVIEPLNKAGIRYLHIGVNASSMVPHVPKVFVWKQGEYEIIVQYASAYGDTLFMEGLDEVLEFAHTGDNLGPQSAEAVEEEFKRIQALYPNARVEASTLDEFAKVLLKVKESLPVIEEEIGDTWIHGIASDPWKVSRYKELLRLKGEWLEKGLLDKNSEAYECLMTNLMLIPEHTWGLDFKKYLADFKNWTKEDFSKARREDSTTLDFLTNRNASMRAVLDTDIKNYRQGVFTGSYSQYESSHEEQRGYLYKALEKLPNELKSQAVKAMDRLIPAMEEYKGNRVSLGSTIHINGWKVKIDGTGAITGLEESNGHRWVKDGQIGKLQYEIFDVKNCIHNYYRYNRNFSETMCWSEGDFSKPGLESAEDLEQTCYDFYVKEAFCADSRLVITLGACEEASEKYGSPRTAQLTYVFEPHKIRLRLSWFAKDANKIPEAVWLKFQLNLENPNRIMMEKLGHKISPLDVTEGGNRKQHCTESISYHGADGQFVLRSLHAPLASIGGRNLYEMDHKVNPMENGIYFNLFNNRWGTNFKMWCEDECAFEYEMEFKSYQ